MEPFLRAAFTALMGGVLVYFIRTAPFVDGPFKQWASYLVAAGTAYAVLVQTGFLGHLRRILAP